MPNSTDSGVSIQRQYYTQTASRYDTMHAQEGVEDPASAQLVVALLRMSNIRSLLDVGSATGRGLREFATALPGALVCGVEPVAALLKQGVASGITQTVPLLQASGDALPFSNASFDAVCEFSILHHVPEPAKVVGEMLRVARTVVVIADSNRFGQGSLPAKLFKLVLFKLGLWKAFDFLRTKGKGYQISEGDGLFYSYSVFDDYDLIASWADRILLLPTGIRSGHSWFQPLLNSEGVILVAFRDRPAPGNSY
jgi:ubiquinone/menaquinone biosynthesis C-methylase UbiE